MSKKSKSNYLKTILKLAILITLFSMVFVSCKAKFTEPFEPIIDESIFIPGTITNYNSGQVRSGILNDNHTIAGLNWASNTALAFYEEGQVDNGILSTNQTLSNVSYSNNTSLFFYQNGVVSNGTINSNQSIDGVNYRQGNFSFYSNGQVISGFLNGDNRIDDIIYHSPTFGSADAIFFYKNGQVSNGKAIQQTITNFSNSYFITTGITFYENGQVGNLVLGALSTINGISYLGNARALFYSNGQISRATLFPAGQVIDDIAYAWHFIYFYPDGQTKQGQLEGDQTITNHGTEYSLEDDDWIRFRADGTYHSHGAVDWNF